MLKSDNHVLDYVDAYLHEALSAGEAELVEQHCDQCPICQVAMDEARKRLEAMQSLPAVEAPERLLRATERRIAQYRGPAAAVMKAGLWIAGAAALLISAFHVYYLNMAPLPYDLKVLGQTEWLAGSQAALRIVLIDRQRGQGLAGVPVHVELAGERPDQVITLASFVTNDLGSGDPRFRLPDWETGRYELRVRARPGETQEAISRAIQLKRSWQLMLVTDKPVYQPGQVIRARSLALRQPDLKPLAGQRVTFSVTDPKGNVVYRQRSVTSRFGIASTDCRLADEIIEGPYQLECQVGDTTSRVTLEVKRYVLPKFSIEVEFDRPYYQPAQRMRGTLRAAYFFGKPVANADVEIELKTADAETKTLERLSTRTDAAGNASFEFLLPDSLVGHQANAGDAVVAVVANVRDSAGQQESKTLPRVVTRQPIRIEVIPEGGSLVRDIPNVVYLLTSYADGRPARTRIAAGLDREVLTNDLGVASVTMEPPTGHFGHFRWTFRAMDEAGQEGWREVWLDCGFAPKDFLIRPDFLVRPDKAVYDSGQTMRLLLRGHGNQPVFIDLFKDGQTVFTDTTAMARGHGEYEFDIPPELFGTIELCAYRFGADGLPVRKTRAIYVRPAHDLAIDTRLDRAEYRPGDRARLTFALSDERGRPAAGAISLAAVDEAVYSVLAGESSLQRSFFTLEQELLKPVYAIYPWSPDVKTQLAPEEQERFEQAIFARTAQPGPIDKYMEGNPHALAVLERPDWEKMAESMELPKELVSLLRQRNWPHSLVATTFPTRLREVEAVKRSGLKAVNAAWAMLAVIGGLTALLFLWCHGPRGWIAVLIVLALLVALILPATQSAREMSTRSGAASELEGLRFVFEQSRAEAGSDAASVRVRQWFPETLLWRPELITDDAGLATIEVDLPDSITSWRLSASAVSGDGKLGGAQASIRVFQPFFVDLDLPLALTRGDEVELPVVVYNYLDEPQSVELSLADSPGLARLDEPVQVVELAAGEVRSVGYRLRAEKIGRFDLEVAARGQGVADAIRRSIEIEPDGRRVEQVVNGNLDQPADVDLAVPDDAIEGSVKAMVRIYPSSFSQLVEGLDAIFQKPYGCFEQTSSTTYPNVLALDYLRRTGKPAPEIEAKARQYIHLGYQRLLSFEVDGGGFDWFGNPPANATLTAYGLMEFDDMARVHDADPALIERTRRWLLDRQQADGAWDPEAHRLHDDPTRGADDLARLSTTAYIGWAVFAARSDDPKAQATRDYLLRHEPAAIDDAYVLALVANALAAIDSSGRAAAPDLARLAQTRHTSADGKLAWWDTSRTLFYGAGRGGSIETTALAAMAMLDAGYEPATTRGALAWLAGQKDALGTWHSTQATVLALKALLAGTRKPLGGEQQRTIEIAAGGTLIHQAVIPADDSDVVKQFDLSAQLSGGRSRLSLTERGGGGVGYQVVLSYHVPGASRPPAQPPMSVELAYDRTELRTGDTLAVKATLVNHMSIAAPMVLVDLPIPAGFAIEADDLAQLAAARRIAKYQLTPRSAIIYLRALPPAQPLTVTYRLRATMPVRITAAPARAYEYYNPDTKAASDTTQLIVSESVPAE